MQPMLQFFPLTGDTFSFQKGSPVKWYWGRPGSIIMQDISKAEAPTFSPKRGVQSWEVPGSVITSQEGTHNCSARAFPPLYFSHPLAVSSHQKPVKPQLLGPITAAKYQTAGQNQVCAPVTAASAQGAQPTQPPRKSSEQEPSCMIWSSVYSHVATVVSSKDYV